MENTEEKKGFWASLLASKQSPCCGSFIEEVPQDESAGDEQPKEEKKENESNEKNSTDALVVASNEYLVLRINRPL